MLRIKSDMGMVAMQRYINKKAVKGYRLKSIVPFILFPPLHFIAFTFKKSATNKIRYLVEYQRFEDDDLKKKYIQHMKDQGWTLFTNVSFNNDALVFYTDQDALISQIKVTREDLMRDAQLQFQHGCILTCLFIIFYSVIPLTNHIDTFIGFISHYFFLIVALATIIYASIKYILIKKSVIK